MSAKEIEYEESLKTFRFYHDYRMKVLNFTIALNAALLVIVIQHIQNPSGKTIISCFSLVATLALLGLEIRTINLANQVWRLSTEMEKDLQLSLMTSLYDYANDHGIPQRYFVWLLYGIIVFVWLFVLFAAQKRIV